MRSTETVKQMDSQGFSVGEQIGSQQMMYQNTMPMMAPPNSMPSSSKFYWS